jgi:hypothetical protein
MFNKNIHYKLHSNPQVMKKLSYNPILKGKSAPK